MQINKVNRFCNHPLKTLFAIIEKVKEKFNGKYNLELALNEQRFQ